jgi:imidazolonepropionase-like amidohydrolase
MKTLIITTKQTIVLLSILLTQQSFAQNKSIVFFNAVAHLGNDSVLQNAIIGIKDGKISMVADAAKSKIDYSAYEEKIDASGKHIYPGFIAPNSTLGLTEVDAVRATQDSREVGSAMPNVRSLIAYNTDSKIIPTVRANGILLAQITPKGGMVSGTSSIVNLDGWNWEDAAYKIDDGIHINWPRLQSRRWIEEEERLSAFEKNKEYNKQTDELKKLFLDAKAYNDNETKEEKNLRFEAMKGLFNETQNLYIHVDQAKEIIEAINFAKSIGIKKQVIVGGKESWMITDFLKENNCAVMLNRIHDLPDRTDEDVDITFKLPYILYKAGILFCLQNEGDMEAMGTRNLPFMAGTAVAYGLNKEQALRAITLNSAKILGIDKTCGSIEIGKDATLFISSGDALDMRTNNVEKAYVKGKELDLNNDQKELYLKYKKKYGLK